MSGKKTPLFIVTFLIPLLVSLALAGCQEPAEIEPVPAINTTVQPVVDNQPEEELEGTSVPATLPPPPTLAISPTPTLSPTPFIIQNPSLPCGQSLPLIVPDKVHKF